MLRAIQLLLLCLPLLLRADDPTSVGPSHGTLLIAGGGKLGPAIVERFIELAGGRDSAIVVIPTADGSEPSPKAQDTFLTKAGCRNVTILHTTNRAVADADWFVEPLRRARAVWFNGGQKWRLADSYLNTRTQRELFALLARGGVIGGSSAGASIQGSYLVRGAREGTEIMMAPGYEQGLGLLRNTAIDQHLLKRNRQEDLLQVIERYPHLLGIGIDESTAIVVEGDLIEVIGDSKVAIYDRSYTPSSNGKRYYFLDPGTRFDLRSRRIQPPAARSTGVNPLEL